MVDLYYVGYRKIDPISPTSLGYGAWLAVNCVCPLGGYAKFVNFTSNGMAVR